MIKRSLRMAMKVALCGLSRLSLEYTRFLPIRRNRVLFVSYHGKQYSCNPRYISEELEKQAAGRLEIAWAFRNPGEFEYLKARGIRVLDINSSEFRSYALTARVIVTNTYYKPSLPRRKGQFFLRTWHGGGAYKRVGADVKQPFFERLFIAMEQHGADLYLSSSKLFTEQTLRGAFGYKGEVLEAGMPRNDMLYNGVNADEVRKRLGLNPGEKLVLYAPTYRDDALVHDSQPDYARLSAALESRFGGTWRVGYRSHHVTMFLDQTKACKGAMDLSKYPDMQELLLATDVLITDYSSSIWDYSLTGKPAFLYCPDLDSYKKERDFYTPIETWPYPAARTNDELADLIAGFDADANARKIRSHHEALSSCESGHASLDCARRILKECVE